MDTAITSLARANSLRGEWSAFGRFLRRPVLPERAAPFSLGSFAPVLRLLLLDLCVMGVLLSIAGLVMSSGVDIPQTALSNMKIGALVVFLAVVIAPLAEETVFRGWLSGRPGHVLAVLILATTGFAVARHLTAYGTGADGTVMAMGGTGILLALAAAVLLRNRDAMGWFQKVFVVFFWLSCLLFASVHIFNFSVENLWSVLPLVLPQFSVATMLGYLRVNYGLWSSMLLHMLHNASFIALVLWATGAA